MTHYFDRQQSGPANEIKIPVRFAARTYEFISASGLFSRDHIDFATKTLIAAADLTNAKTVLDLGCGWGAVAVILALSNPDKEFAAVDMNDHAVSITKKNARLHRVKINVLQSNIFDRIEDSLFDCILTNPPYVAGREVCFKFITESFEHLNKNGSLQLVARHNKGGKILSQKMEETFGNMEVLDRSGGFRVYKSIKKE